MPPNFRFYSNTSGPAEWMTAKQLLDGGYQWLHADVTCPHCDKEQSVAATGYVGGPCIKCGEPTSGETSEQLYGTERPQSPPGLKE